MKFTHTHVCKHHALARLHSHIHLHLERSAVAASTSNSQQQLGPASSSRPTRRRTKAAHRALHAVRYCFPARVISTLVHLNDTLAHKLLVVSATRLASDFRQSARAAKITTDKFTKFQASNQKVQGRRLHNFISLITPLCYESKLQEDVFAARQIGTILRALLEAFFTLVVHSRHIHSVTRMIS